MKKTLLILLAHLFAAPGFSQQSSEELAKAAQNPVSDLISLPFQNNTSFGIGPYDRTNNVTNIQPVVPVQVGNWNLVNRTIAPLVYQPDFREPSGGAYGLDDINHTLFFSPAEASKLIWGVGPIVSFPTATNNVLGTGKLGLGPSVVLLAMPGRWVVGMLFNNLWSVAGDAERADVNQMLIQYFLNYNFGKGWYVSSAPIITSNWEAQSGNRWIVPFGGGVGRIFRVGAQPVNGQVQAFYNAVRPDGAPDWTLRLQFQLMFPK